MLEYFTGDTCVESAADWLLERLVKENHDVVVKIAIGLWGIWSARNVKVWENKQISLAIAMDCSIKQISERREVRKKQVESGKRSGSSEGVKWKAPREGKL